MTRILAWCAAALAATLVACAHPMSIAPDLAKLDAPAAAPKPGTVGLISRRTIAPAR